MIIEYCKPCFSSVLFHLYRSRREAELNDLQRCIEDETRRHEGQLSELRVKHSAAIDNLQEQLDNSKRVREPYNYTEKHMHVKTCTLTHRVSPLFSFSRVSPWRRPRRCWRRRGWIRPPSWRVSKRAAQRAREGVRGRTVSCRSSEPVWLRLTGRGRRGRSGCTNYRCNRIWRRWY